MAEANTILSIAEGLSYDLKAILGRGSYGSMVFVGEFGEKKQQVAVKRFQWNHIKSNSIAKFEATFLSKELNDPNILQYLAIRKDPNFLFIVTELCAGTLQHLVEGKYQGPPIGDIDEKGILLQVTSGLTYLHSSNIVHRDIKPSNILIFFPPSEAVEMRKNSRALFKLADFGIVSTLITDERDFRKNNKEYVDPHGTRGWIPPDLYDSDTDYDSKVDIFALGCVFGYTLSDGKHLFGDSPLEQAIRILHKKPMTLVLANLKQPFCNDGKLFELIESMVKMEPNDRPSSNAVLNNPFFLEYETGMADEEMTTVVGELSCKPQHRRGRGAFDNIVYRGTENEKNTTVGLLRYDPKDIIGQGGFSLVFKGFHSLKLVAVKRVQKIYNKESNDDDSSAIKKKVDVMKAAGKHPNILHYIGTEMNEDFLFIVMELCKGTLKDYLNGEYDGPKFKSERDILQQITRGLAHLHKLGIVHRDIKPTSILIGGNKAEPQIKLADFGMSKALRSGKKDHTNSNVNDPSGTRGWMPPELYEKDRFDTKVDIFALGCIFAYTLCQGKHPFGEDVDKRLDLIRTGQSMLVDRKDAKGPHKWDFQAFPLIKSMLKTDPSKRLTVEDVLNHPFFIPYEDRWEYFRQLWSSFKDSLRSDKQVQLEEFLRDMEKAFRTAFENTPLHDLCQFYENDDLVNLIILSIEKGADVNAENENGETPLHLLCEYYENDNIKVITQLLIENGADANAKDEHGNNPLHSLCNNAFKSNKDFNRKEIFQLLIENGADVNAVDQFDYTILHKLIRNDKKNDDLVDIVKLLIKKHLDVNAKDKHGNTPLHDLCLFYKNDNLVDIIHLLTENGANVNTKNNNGETPLHYLCEQYKNDNAIEEEKTLRVLVGFFQKHGASINEKDNDGWTPNDYLIRRENSINMLPMEPIKLPEKANHEKLSESIRSLIKDGRPTADSSAQLVQLLRDDSIDVNVKLDNGFTPLHYLCHCYEWDNLIDFVRLLITKGADVNIMDTYGKTSLHYLCLKYNKDNLINIVQLFIDKGANVNAENKDGETPLLMLCKKYRNKNIVEIVQLMIKSGADVKAVNRDRENSLHLLRNDYYGKLNYKNLVEVAQLLIENGADVNAVDKFGNTPLPLLYKKYEKDIRINKIKGETPLHYVFMYMYACEHNNDNLIDIIQLLLEKDAEVNKIIKAGWNPLHYLFLYYENENLIDIIQIWITKGAKVNTKDEFGRTPLHKVCSNYKKDNLIHIVQLLITNGAEVNTKDKYGWTPLHSLCSDYKQDNLIDIVQLLIQNGANVNAKVENGSTPLHYLCRYYKTDDEIKTENNLKTLISLFEKHGASMDAKNNEGTTPNDYLIRRK